MEFEVASFKTRAWAFLIFPRRLPSVGYSTSMQHLDELLVPFQSSRLSWLKPADEGLIGLQIFFEFGLGKTTMLAALCV